MAQDILHSGAKRCFACIQWEGRRSYDPASGSIRTDQGSEGNCRVKHVPVKGNRCCNLYFPLR